MYPLDNKQAAGSAGTADSGTARLIDLGVDQIKAALDEAFAEIDALSGAVLDTARHANALLDAIKARKPDVNPADESDSVDGQALQKAVQDTFMRLQFADRLNQRLSNVSTNLTGLAELVRSTERPITDIQWAEFLQQTRATFTMEPEREMFDALFAAQSPTAGDGAASNDA